MKVYKENTITFQTYFNIYNNTFIVSDGPFHTAVISNKFLMADNFIQYNVLIT